MVIRNKFENLREIIKQNIDMLAVLLFHQLNFSLKDIKVIILDISHKSGGLLVYVQAIIPSCQLFIQKF